MPLKVGGAPKPLGTTELPKATVPLGAPQQLGQPTGLQAGADTIAGFDDDEEDAGTGTATSVLAILALVAALVALTLQILTTKTWADSDLPDTREFSDAFSL